MFHALFQKQKGKTSISIFLGKKKAVLSIRSSGGKKVRAFSCQKKKGVRSSKKKEDAGDLKQEYR